MSWIILFLAGIFEIAMAFCMAKIRGTSGMEFWLWIVAVVFSSLGSMGLLAKALQTLPISISYAIWTGIGVAGTVILGIFYFKEPATAYKLFFLTTLLGSIIGLKLAA